MAIDLIQRSHYIASTNMLGILSCVLS